MDSFLYEATFRRHLSTTCDDPKARAETLRRAGLEQYRAGDYNSALKSYHDALALDPHSSEIRVNRALLLLKIGWNNEAAEDCRFVLRRDPNHGRAHGRLGVALMNLGRLDEARIHLENAVRLEPGNVEFRQYLVYCDESRLTSMYDPVKTNRLFDGDPFEGGSYIRHDLRSPMWTETPELILSDYRSFVDQNLQSSRTPGIGELVHEPAFVTIGKILADCEPFVASIRQEAESTQGQAISSPGIPREQPQTVTDADFDELPSVDALLAAGGANGVMEFKNLLATPLEPRTETAGSQGGTVGLSPIPGYGPQPYVYTGRMRPAGCFKGTLDPAANYPALLRTGPRHPVEDIDLDVALNDPFVVNHAMNVLWKNEIPHVLANTIHEACGGEPGRYMYQPGESSEPEYVPDRAESHDPTRSARYQPRQHRGACLWFWRARARLKEMRDAMAKAEAELIARKEATLGAKALQKIKDDVEVTGTRQGFHVEATRGRGCEAQERSQKEVVVCTEPNWTSEIRQEVDNPMLAEQIFRPEAANAHTQVELQVPEEVVIESPKFSEEMFGDGAAQGTAFPTHLETTVGIPQQVEQISKRKSKRGHRHVAQTRATLEIHEDLSVSEGMSFQAVQTKKFNNNVQAAAELQQQERLPEVASASENIPETISEEKASQNTFQGVAEDRVEVKSVIEKVVDRRDSEPKQETAGNTWAASDEWPLPMQAITSDVETAVANSPQNGDDCTTDAGAVPGQVKLPEISPWVRAVIGSGELGGTAAYRPMRHNLPSRQAHQVSVPARRRRSHGHGGRGAGGSGPHQGVRVMAQANPQKAQLSLLQQQQKQQGPQQKQQPQKQHQEQQRKQQQSKAIGNVPMTQGPHQQQRRKQQQPQVVRNVPAAQGPHPQQERKQQQPQVVRNASTAQGHHEQQQRKQQQQQQSQAVKNAPTAQGPQQAPKKKYKGGKKGGN